MFTLVHLYEKCELYSANLRRIKKRSFEEIVKTLKSENSPKRPRTRLGAYLLSNNEIEPNDAMTVYVYLKMKINLTKSNDNFKVSKIMMKIEKKWNKIDLGAKKEAGTDLEGIYKGS